MDLPISDQQESEEGEEEGEVESNLTPPTPNPIIHDMIQNHSLI